MESLYVSLKDMQSVDKLFEIFNEIENLNILNYSIRHQLSKADHSKEIEDRIKSLEYSVFRKYKLELDEIMEVIPTINLKSTKELSYFFDNINEDAKKEIFSYIYWKFKNINSDFKVNLQNLKKVLGFIKGKEAYIKPFTINMICSKCNSIANVYVFNYEYNYFKFKCLTCGHEEDEDGYYDSFYILKNCNCESCIRIKKNLYHSLKNNLSELFDKIHKALLEEYSKLELIDAPSPSSMYEDFRLYSSTISKDEREILSLNPKNIDELINIVGRIKQRDAKYRKGNKDIIKLLLDHRIIYIIKTKLDLNNISDMLRNDVLNTFIEIKENNKKILSLDHKVDVLNTLYTVLKDATYEMFNEIYKEDLIFKINNNIISINIDIKYHKQIELKLNGNYFCENVIINENYTKGEVNTSSNKELLRNEIIKRVLKSEPEKNVYTILRNKYDNYIVLPNYSLNKIIDLNKLSSFFTIDEKRYLESCIPDFIICNYEGEPLKVIELQKGGHHNDPDWIKKDNLKKRVFQILGIEFEEMF